jgi:hypothetical protein
MLYMKGRNDPVSVLDEVEIVQMNDNHQDAPYRVLYTTARFNASNTMLELHRDERMTLKLEDGRVANVLVQHASLDMKGRHVGVLRVLGDFDG